MGISNLLQFLKPIIKNTHISKYENGVVGIDIMCWIHRGLISCAFDIVTDNHNENYLSFIEKMLETIYQYNIKVIFVFDGEELPEKKKENLIRKARREKAKNEALEIIKKVKNPRTNELVIKKCIQAITVSKEIIQSVINFCKKKNIYYIISPYEADAQLSYLCRMGFISCAISEDSDLLVYGCPRVLYKFKNNGECNEITLMPINDLIDSDIINKIKNPISNSFNQFYITPIKNIQNEESNFSDSFISYEEKQSPTFSRKRRRNVNNEKKKKKKKLKKIINYSWIKILINQNSNKLMKTYINNFYWPEELYKLKYFDLDMFLTMCILSGCDYTNDFHISGMGIKTAFNLIYEHKTIQNIFSFLISHDKWKNKIPPNLNSVDKLMEKYNKIKNAFLQHHVYDFILNKIIPIHHSFRSFIKKENSNLLSNSDHINNRFKLDDDIFVNKVIESSLFLDFSKNNNKCLNNLLEQDIINQKDDNKNIEIIEDNSQKTPLFNNSNFNSLPFHNKHEISPQQNINHIDNIFKHFTSECLEYLEISPAIIKRHKQINQIDSKYDKNAENVDNKSEPNFINKNHINIQNADNKSEPNFISKNHINIQNADNKFEPNFINKNHINTQNNKFTESMSNQNDQTNEHIPYDHLDKKNKQMKSAKNLYENMKKTFTLFKTLADKEEIKHDLNSPQKDEPTIQDPTNFMKKNNYIKSEKQNEIDAHSFIPPLNRSKLHIKKKSYNGQLQITNFFKNSNKDELINNNNNNTNNHSELKSDQNINHIYNSPNKLKQIETDHISTDQDRDIHNKNTTCKDFIIDTDWKNTKNYIHSSKLTQNNSNTLLNKTQQNDKNINLDYMLQNLNYNYQPKTQKINTFDYFKEKENDPHYNPYIDNTS
ncbi:exonuclease I, putative [Plasmodium yoelii]|uniref:Exonuclease 1 n=1 Tax=Plasmodium yoelii TaxID=5861 RepID=A0A077Y4B3_PLAYE|nr:exonuclease I, putative [Plasmodium yoelii]